MGEYRMNLYKQYFLYTPTTNREEEHRHTPINNSFKENKLSRNKPKQWSEEPLKWKLHTSGWKTDKKGY